MIKGEVGLFAARDLKKGTVVAKDEQFKTQFYRWDEVELDKITKKKMQDFCQMEEGGFYAPADLNCLSMGWFMNHSCDPNVGVNEKGDFVTMKNVRQGEELAWDYSYGEIDSEIEMECHCGGKNCRKIMTGKDWRLPSLLKNAKYFMPNLRKKVSQLKKTNGI